jgi:hypothetical protein
MTGRAARSCIHHRIHHEITGILFNDAKARAKGGTHQKRRKRIGRPESWFRYRDRTNIKLAIPALCDHLTTPCLSLDQAVSFWHLKRPC